jgi:hypothetical protein
MLDVCSILLLLAASDTPTSRATPPSSRGSWEKVFDGGTDFLIGAVHAASRDAWIAGGSRGVVTGSGRGIKVDSTHDRAVLGFFADGPASVYAVGQGELIWRFDGNAWTEEHVGRLAPKGRDGGIRRGADLLHFAYRESASPSAPLVALGPSLVLVRQPDGTWTKPAEPDRVRLWKLGQLGPSELAGRPAKCDALAWRWIRTNLAMFFCADRRAFLYEGAAVTAKGKMPPQCGPSTTSIAHAAGELFASCASSTLWRTSGETWHEIPGPPDKRLKEIPSLSVADGCLFVAGDHAVWRSCGPLSH